MSALLYSCTYNAMCACAYTCTRTYLRTPTNIFFVSLYGRAHAHLCNLMLSPIYAWHTRTHVHVYVYYVLWFGE